LMVVAVVEPWERALTLQLTSLFSADSRMPRSLTVMASLSLRTVAVRMSVRKVRKPAIQYQAPTPLAATSSTAMARMPSLTPVPMRWARAIRDGLRFGEPFWPLVFGLSGDLSVGCAGATVSSVTGCKLIGPHSSGIKRHQFHITVKLQTRIQVRDPDGRHRNLRSVQRCL